MTGRIILGKPISDKIRATVKNQVDDFKKKYGFNPMITSIIIGANPEARLYLRLRDKACAAVGIESIHEELPEDVTEKEVINIIKKHNSDGRIHGILIQFPLPSGLSVENIMNSIEPGKDVEGFTPENLGNLLIGNEFLVPCTPLAVIKILEHEDINLEGKHVVIVNHSTVVGKPLTALCLNRNATVSIAHVYTKNLLEITRQADILITAAGVPGLITKDHIKDGTGVIDVSIVNTSDGVTGDIRPSEVQQKAAFITPVPGGVGPVTVACALSNMMKTAEHLAGATENE
jgi:methylenetetrahydrofolate dehydrogenase (NADP+) / methenyltetrahydrofolate cyclohydrolase